MKTHCQIENPIIQVYAAYALDSALRYSSSSGGIFTLLAKKILSQGGVVYGCAMRGDCYGAQYKRVTDEADLAALRGSKYLQADVGDTFRWVKKDLMEGKKVLFTGTGCYVNGLKTFLAGKYDGLFCMDIICHGTPSPKLWKEYAKYQEVKHNSKLTYVSFRNKERQKWKDFMVCETFGNRQNGKSLYLQTDKDPYFSLFLSNVCLRPSCYACTAKYYKCADITVADFWGINNVAPEMNDNMGTSLVITRTVNGQALFDSIKPELEYKEVSYEEGVRENKSEYQSYPEPPGRTAFFSDMNTIPFEELYKKYLYIPAWKKAGRMVKCIIYNIFGGGA